MSLGSRRHGGAGAITQIKFDEILLRNLTISIAAISPRRESAYITHEASGAPNCPN
jgi:hypothetical protein